MILPYKNKIDMMRALLLATYLLILKSWNFNVYAEMDPCNKDIYRILPRAAYRGRACLNDPDKQTCDASLITSWYRAVANGKDLKMQEEEAYLFECGTKWPYWMDGKHPKPSEGIVNRTLLQALSSQKTTIQVKNCHDEYYNYYLHPTAACPEAYCFGATQNDTCPPFDPCDIYEHQKIDYSPEHSGYCVSSSGETCSTNYEKDWVTFRDKDYQRFLNVSSWPVRSGACGSSSPMWIKEVESTDKDGVRTLRICVGSDTSYCERHVTARAKDCRWFTVYEVPKKVGCGRLCLDDPSASCAVMQVSTTKETSAKTTTAKATKTPGAQSTSHHATTTQTQDDLIKNVTAGSMPVSSTEASVHTSKKLPLSTQSSDVTTKQWKSKTTSAETHDKQTGSPEDNQPKMVIAVAIAVSVVAIVILIVVIVAFRRKCFETQQKLQQPDPDDHYYLHIAAPITSESEESKDNNQVNHEYADIKQVYVNA